MSALLTLVVLCVVHCVFDSDDCLCVLSVVCCLSLLDALCCLSCLLLFPWLGLFVFVVAMLIAFVCLWLV